MASLSSILASRNINVGTGGTGGTGGGTGGGTTPTPSGGGAVVSGNASTFDTLADLQSASIQAGVNTVRTMGYYAIGDYGGAAYRRKAATEPTYELDRTSNGGAVRWELIPERTEIWLEQAGAKSPTNFNAQDNDCYPCFRAIDKFAKAKGLTGYTLRVCERLYFSSKAWQFKRITTKVKGTSNGSGPGSNGTTIRFPVDQCGLITNYKWGMGHDYMMALPNWDFTNPLPSYRDGAIGRGICVYTGANGGVPDGSVYRIVGAGTSPSNGAAGITSTTPGVDITWGTIKLRYEGNLITDPVPGGGTMDYDCGADDNSSAGACVFENLQLWGFFDGIDNGLWKLNNAGIVMRIRGHVNNVFALGWAGHGIAAVADGDPTLSGPGNTNGTYIEHCSAYWNGKDGIHLGWSNGNCVVVICADVSSNGRWGIADWGFLGNSITGVESAYDGRQFASARQYYGQCQYQGWMYLSKLPNLGASPGWPAYINENPATDSNAWVKYYKTANEDLVNAEQVVTGTTGATGWITLGAAVSGKQTWTAAGVGAGAPVWYRITDGANYEVGAADFYPTGFGGATADTLHRGPKPQARAGGGVVASSLPMDARGIYPLLTLTGSATIKAICVAENWQESAAWQPEVRFEPNGAYSTVTIAARSVWQYIYIEGGTNPAQWCWPTLVLGGMLNNSYEKSRGVIAIDDGAWTALSVKTGAIMPDNSGANQIVSFGSGGNIMDWLGYVGQRWGLRHPSLTSGDIIFENQVIGPGQYPPVYRIGSDNLWGRTSSGDWGGGNSPMQISRFVLGDGGNGGRAVQMGSGPPGSGYHAKGEFILNDGTGSDNTTFLWRCTASGTPGTWAARA
jgi:hypothetical protein